MIHGAVVHLATVHLPTVPVGGRSCGKALEAGPLAGLGVEEELRGGDDPVTGRQAGAHLDETVTVGAELDGDGAKATVAQGEHHAVTVAGAYHGLRRHRQHRVAGGRFEDDAGKHVRPQRAVGVGEAKAQAQGAGHRVQGRVDEIHAPTPLASGVVVRAHADRHAHADPVHLALEHLGLDPHAAEGPDRHERRPRLDVEALADVEFIHKAVMAGGEGHGLAHGPVGLDCPHQRSRYLQRRQPLPRGPRQVGVVAAQRQHELFLGVNQVRRVQRVERFAGAHGVTGGLNVELLDPAGDPRVHVGQAVLVPAHVAHRAQRRTQHAALDEGRTHAEVVLHGRRDSHRAGGVGAGALARLIDGHQVHAHGGLARFVAAIGRIHGGHPVQGFPGFCPRRIPLGGPVRQHESEKRAAGRGGQQRKAGRERSVHGCWPPRLPAR